jgi:succinate dehydrogenase / fumarate reductase cytochrome b subunit
MSTTAIHPRVKRPLHFWQSTNGKKFVMAVTGAILFAFILLHLAGNLLVFAGPEKFDQYAVILHFDEGLLWSARTILIVAVVLHILSATQLAVRNKRARPIGYARWQPTESTYAARTMYWSGPIVLAFIIFHLLQFTSGTIHPQYQYIHLAVYHNVTAAFHVWWVSAWYIFALILLGLHLRHGLWSMFQSMGWSGREQEPILKRAAWIVALLIVLGFISIPISVMLGLV